MNMPRKRSTLRTLGVAAGAATLLSMSGCNNAGQGLFSGAALGATTGLILGSMTGEAGEGAAAGAVIGALGGAIIGDQNERNARNHGHRPRYESRRSGHYGYGHDRPWWESDGYCD